MKKYSSLTLLHPRVLQETDNQGGKAELGRMADIASYGRIRIVKLQDFEDYESKPDDEIIAAAKKNNAIVRDEYFFIISEILN